MAETARQHDDRTGGFRYADTPQQVIEWLSNPGDQAWVQNMHTRFAKGELYPEAFRSVEEYDLFVAGS